MRVWLFFLTICFVLGGTRLGRQISRRPSWVMAFCVVASASYYSYRVVR